MAANREKTALRKQAEAARGMLTPEERAALSAAICSRASAYLAGTFTNGGPPGVLLAYLPFRTEIDLLPLLEWAWEKGWSVAAPRTIPGTKTMQAHLLASLADTECAGPWGLREPKPDCPIVAPAAIGAVLMPGLAFDRSLGRLGYGGGFYDRYLTELRRTTGRLPLLLALAFEVQVVEQVPLEEHDIRMHVVITETSLYESC